MSPLFTIINILTMRMLKNEKVYQYIQLASLVFLPWGLFFFEAMASILVITFSLPLLIYGGTISWSKINRYVWPFFLIFGVILVSGFWSANTARWISLLRVNLPYIFLPMAFFLWPGFLLQHRRVIQQQFIWAGIALSLYLGGYLMINLEEVLMRMGEGGYFPVPVHHVRTSLFLVLAGMFCWEEVGKQRWLSRGFVLYSGFLLILILGIHLLAVRTGLVLFYVGTFLILLLNKNLRGRKAVLWMLLLILIVVFAIIFIPTIQQKWNYFQEDIRNYDSAAWWFYSDAVRWESNDIGLQIAREAPWWGVGMGDVLEEVQMRFYLRDAIRIQEYPHNLWITFLAGSGIIGFGLLNLALVRLFLVFYRDNSTVFFILFILYMVSCLVENTLLTSLGSISFVIITLLAKRAYCCDKVEMVAEKLHPEQS